MAEIPKYAQALTTAVKVHDEQIANMRRETADLGQKLDSLKDAVAGLRQQFALMEQKLDEHIKRTELWDSRRWALILLLSGAILSLASGLIVSLSRR